MRNLISTIFLFFAFANLIQSQTQSGLYCKYDFNGNAARDYVGGTSENQDFINATATTDRFGNAASAYNFSAANNQIITYPSSNFTPIDNDDFSISCWIKADASNGAQRVIISHYYSFSCGNTRSFALVIEADDSLSFKVYEPGSTISYATITFGTITDTDWHHIVVGYKMVSSTNLSFISYIDGVSSPSTRLDNIVSPWSGTDGTVARAGIGSFPQIGVGACATNSPFGGRIDDIYFYSKLLNATEVLANYNAPNYTLSRIKYVDKNAISSANSGESWANAYLSLQDALSINSIPGDTIFVMEGNYVSGTGYNIQTENLKIFGGFSPTGTTLATRDWYNHKTVLDGDVNSNDIYPVNSSNLGFLSDNADKVLTISASETVVDGFTFRGGNGSTVYSVDHGFNSTNITLRNCELTESSNDVLASKVGLYVSESNSVSHTFTVENCHFHDLYGRYFVPFHFNLVNNTIMNVFFINNLVNDNKTVDLSSTGHEGGAGGAFVAMDNSDMNVKIINSTFANNLAQGTNMASNLAVISTNEEASATANLNIECYNSIFWGNTANRSFDIFNTSYEKMTALTLVNNVTADLPDNTYSNSFSMTNASQTDPLFENAAAKDYALSNASTAINAGTTTGISMYIPMYDVRMMTRTFGTAIDLGAIENQVITALDKMPLTTAIAVYPNPTSTILNIDTNKKIDYLRIYATNGVLVKEIQNPDKVVNVQELITGLYILEIASENEIGFTKFTKN